MANRQYDLVVWGATGFTGKWVAKHLYDHHNASGLKWALAGRSAEKLAEVQDFIGDAQRAIPCVIADSNDSASLESMVKQTTAIISTVGPYAYYGSSLVQACAQEGTHYVDLAGEVPWMRAMIDAHHYAAQRSGAKIVHSCGFDSIPSDMGTYYMQKQAQARFGQPLQQIKYALIKSKGGMSGGTAHSMLNVLKLAASDKRIRKLLNNPYSLNPDPSLRGGDAKEQSGVEFNAEIDRWTAPFLMAGINTRIVRRSNALLDNQYGADFLYSETMATGKGMSGYLAAKGLSAAIKSMVVIGITSAGRGLLSKILPAQGEGPKVDPLDPGFYVIQFNGKTADGRTLVGRLHGDGDPGYGSTSKILAESGLCLALDKLNVKGGFWTPASAMGDALLARLEGHGGLRFEIIE